MFRPAPCWTFVMLTPSQNALVVNYIAERSRYPLVGMRIWALCFQHLNPDTGEILLSREDIAEQVAQPSNVVSSVMSELVAFGAIIRMRRPVAGRKGPGLVYYFMNPRVGVKLKRPPPRGTPLLRVVR